MNKVNKFNITTAKIKYFIINRHKKILLLLLQSQKVYIVCKLQ